MSGFLLDTNVISELIRRPPDARVAAWIRSLNEELVYLSVLTLGEVRKGIVLARDAARRTRLEAWLAADLRIRFSGRILPVDEAIADRWGRLTASARSAGKVIPVIDGLLAATALHHNLVFATRNTGDISTSGVATFNPWTF